MVVHKMMAANEKKKKKKEICCFTWQQFHNTSIDNILWNDQHNVIFLSFFPSIRFFYVSYSPPFMHSQCKRCACVLLSSVRSICAFHLHIFRCYKEFHHKPVLDRSQRIKKWSKSIIFYLPHKPKDFVWIYNRHEEIQ